MHTVNLVRLGAVHWLCAIRSPAAFQSFRPLRRFSTTKNARCAHNEARSDVERAAIAATSGVGLCDKAQEFLRRKNAAGRGDATLAPVFDMCGPAVDLYGLRGDEVRPGLTSFFGAHPGLTHELLAAPVPCGPSAVQYPFVKSWRSPEDGEVRRWSSIEAAKPRNKVERLEFDGEGLLVRVSVVEATAPISDVTN